MHHIKCLYKSYISYQNIRHNESSKDIASHIIAGPATLGVTATHRKQKAVAFLSVLLKYGKGTQTESLEPQTQGTRFAKSVTWKLLCFGD